MKFQINQKKTRRTKFKFLPIFFLILFACATAPTKTYEETVSQWKSYEDVAKWMSWHFTYDMARLKESSFFTGRPLKRRSPDETFKLKSGVCVDAAFFAKITLNLIDPSYEAKVVFIDNGPYDVSHFVCSFEKDGKLFIMDYGTSYRTMVGVHGPFNTLDEYKKFYERYHPKVKHVQSIRYW
jgi:hypothetical protein